MNYPTRLTSAPIDSCLPMTPSIAVHPLSILMVASTHAVEIASMATSMGLSGAVDDPAAANIRVFSVQSMDEAKAFLRQRKVDAILLDHADLNQADVDGMPWLCRSGSDLPILMIAEGDSVGAARHAIDAGADDVLSPTDLTKENIRWRIEIAIARKAADDSRLRYAREDRQTGLANTHLLEERFERALARADRFATLVGLVTIDVDGFDELVARHGQGTSDHLLTLVGQRLLGEARQTDTLARTRDHGFTWLVEGFSAIDDISSLVSRLPDRLARPFSINGRDVCITASAGVAVCPFHGQEFRHVHRKAEAAMIDVATISGDALLMLPVPPLRPVRPAALT